MPRTPIDRERVASMRVIEVDRFGGPDVLTARTVDDPVAGPGSVVVDVSGVDTLFIDTQLRSGWGQEYFTVRPPYVPGGGIAGVVGSVGAGVDSGWLGRRVIARLGESGAYAQRAVAAESALVPVPDGLDLEWAAALIHDGPTAYELRAAAAFPPGEWVLVTAAAGGLGLLLVQLAHAAGAKVVGAARGRAKLAAVERRGADAVVDYSLDGWAERVRGLTGGFGPRLVLDGAGGAPGRAAFAVTAEGGRFVGYGASAGGFADPAREEAARRDVEVVGLFDLGATPAEQREYAGQALADAAAGQLRPWVGLTVPLERAAEAHAAIEGRRVIGKTLLTAEA